MYNVQASNGKILLGCNVQEDVANKWVKYYQNKYPVGKPFPNGKGYYNLTFEVIKV